jgi:hypothetical protein
MKQIPPIIALIASMCIFAHSQSLFSEVQFVNEINLLKSDRNDVARILAARYIKTGDDSRYFESFSTKNAFVEIYYSRGECSGDSDWNVPEWKVTQIEISPRSTVWVNDIGLDFSKYKFERLYGNLVESYIYYDKDLGIAIEVDRNAVLKIRLFPSKIDYLLSCSPEKAKKFYSKKNYFVDSKLEERIFSDLPNFNAEVVELRFAPSSISANWNSTDPEVNSFCALTSNEIAIETQVKDRENDVLIYAYKVSAGEIIGKGKKILWDLTDVKPGSYTITAAVDDGCGFCGKTLTKTVILQDCPKTLGTK